MDNYMLGELSVLYDAKHLQTMFELPNVFVWHYVWPDELFADNVLPVIQDIEKELFLSIDHELAQQLHTKWLRNLTRNKQI